MQKLKFAIAVSSLFLVASAASAYSTTPTLVLCTLHGDTWIEGLEGAQSLEIIITTSDADIDTSAYVPLSANPPMVLSGSTIHDRTWSYSGLDTVELGYFFDRYSTATWTFQYDIGHGMTPGAVTYYVPEPASMALLGLGALALRRKRR